MSLDTSSWYEKGEAIISWKTKDINSVVWEKNLVIMTNNDNVSAWDGDRIESSEWVADHSTTITSNVFKYLNAKWIRTHFKERLSNSEILVEECDMLPVECVFRFVATWSFIKREKALKWDDAIEDGTILEEPITELYYKNDVITDKWEKISDPMIFLWDDRLPLLDDNLKLVLLDPKTGERLNYNSAYEPGNDEKIDDEEFKIESFNVRQHAKELLEKTKEAWEWIKEMYNEVWLNTYDGKVEFWRNGKWEIILADVVDWASCRIKIPYVIEWDDWKTYLAWDFTREELNWVWWYDYSYFEKLDAIPDNVGMKKIILAEWLDKDWYRKWWDAKETATVFELLAEKSTEALSKAEIEKIGSEENGLYTYSVLKKVDILLEK